MSGQPDHTIAFGDGPWRVWRWALLRAAGFPAAGIDRLRSTSAAAAADEFLEAGSTGDRGRYDHAFDVAVASIAEAVCDAAADPLFREAVTWQNPALVETMLDRLRAAGPSAPRNVSRRRKEIGVARYWSRYALKNDTIGFFGPICWVRIGGAAAVATDDAALSPGVTARPGAALVRARRVVLERWALAAYAERIAADPAIRRYLPAMLTATVSVSGATLRHPTRGDVTLGAAAAAVAARCDGRRAVDVATAVAADPTSGVRRIDDAYLQLQALVDKEFVTWGIDLPVTMEAEAVLCRAFEAIDDPEIRARAESGYHELCASRDAVTAAAGDADMLRQALAALDATFSRLTGRQATQAAGQMYVGRTVCFEDTTRDLEVTISDGLLTAAAAPLSLLCIAARWLSANMADAYQVELRSIYDDLAADRPRGDVPFAELSFLAQGLFFGAGPKPADAVAEEFTRRWTRLLGLDTAAREVHLDAADLAPQVALAFDAARPGWAFARYHSPDLHVVRDDDGDVSFVLGELHAAWNTLDSECLVRAHEDPAALLAYQAHDIPAGRLLPLYPVSWPRLTPRTCVGLRHPDDWQLGFVPAPGAQATRLLPVTALSVTDRGDDLVVRASGGREWPLTEVFAALFATHTVDAFKLLGAHRHSPRVWIDRMVVARETWRRTVGELDFAKVNDERERFLRVRQWRASLGLPERVFVKLATEVKPVYVDLTSPVFVSVLCLAVRAGLRDGGPDAAVTISEMLPAPESAWVPDAAGNRYVSELRLLMVDPAKASWTGDVR